MSGWKMHPPFPPRRVNSLKPLRLKYRHTFIVENLEVQDDVVQKKIFAICVYFDECYCYCDEGKVTRSATLLFTSLDTSQIRQIKSEVLCLPFC